ncbi:sorbitol dehydrogenase-like [Oppia nitens]|uniref:sorbitol dehydrogenase-like n=1 Tax=Oppia nitens TaxID=1686743 RepID=UPI0023DB9B5A|nr:sorbitol dehydrogenase-like [Oppia nitens]XP_054159348.1 sorbitol dehydrogenase-like [Oppia nitens]
MSSSTNVNLSAVLHKVLDLRVESTQMPEKPGYNEVILKTLCVGLCGSDHHYWKHGKIAHFEIKDPLILGHETCAQVVEVGPGVHHIKVGDRVAAEPTLPCRLCDYCKTGSYNLCPDVKCHGTPPVNGTLRQYFKYDADFCFKLEDNMTNEEGALIEPMAVAVHSCRRAKVSVGNSVLICGSGPIGLVNILVAKQFGATKIFITDINADRLKVAEKLGADKTILIDPKLSDKENIDQVMKIIGKRVDASIECTGVESAIKLAMLCTKSGGKAVLVGLGPSEVTIPVSETALREVDVRGIFRYTNCFPLASTMIASGKIDVKPLVSHHFPLKDVVKAFETFDSGVGIKIMVHLDK